MSFILQAPVAGKTLYLTTVGNHESDWPGSPSYYQVTDSGGECGVVTTRLIPMPYPATTNTPWWSYDVGLIHMIGIFSCDVLSHALNFDDMFSKFTLHRFEFRT